MYKADPDKKKQPFTNYTLRKRYNLVRPIILPTTLRGMLLIVAYRANAEKRKAAAKANYTANPEPKCAASRSVYRSNLT